MNVCDETIEINEEEEPIELPPSGKTYIYILISFFWVI